MTKIANSTPISQTNFADNSSPIKQNEPSQELLYSNAAQSFRHLENAYFQRSDLKVKPKVKDNSDDKTIYKIYVPLPAELKEASHEQLQRAVIKAIYEKNGIQLSKAAIEEISAKHKFDFTPKYDYEAKEWTYNTKDGLMMNVANINYGGKNFKGYELNVSQKFEQTVLANKELAQEITASGKKAFSEIQMAERMKMVMERAKKYLPADAYQALQLVDPRTLLAGLAVGAALGAGANKGKIPAKALGYVGAAITLAQVLKYGGDAQHIVDIASKAKKPEDLEEAAKETAELIKNGGMDLLLSAVGYGAGKLMPKAGQAIRKTAEVAGELADDAIRVTKQTIEKANELIAKANNAVKKYGEIFEPQMVTPEGVRIKPSQVDDFNKINVNEMRAKKTLSGVAPESHVINSLKAEFQPTNFQFGNNTFKLDWKGMKHILQRHHPEFWDGSVKKSQSYFDAKTKIEELQRVIGEVLQQNRETLIKRGNTGQYQIKGEYNGKKYTLGINDGRIGQLYTPVN